jgi:cytochrome b involved in lipid metabolism
MMLTQRSKNLAGQPIRKKKITLEEVSRHNTEEDCWTILEEKVSKVYLYILLLFLFFGCIYYV